jgi:phosphoribosylcarboxyaminoimidazole (NCAIR) mutase
MKVLWPRLLEGGSFILSGFWRTVEPDLPVIAGCQEIQPSLAKGIVNIQDHGSEALFSIVQIPKGTWVEVVAEKAGSSDEIGMRVGRWVGALTESVANITSRVAETLT